MIGFQNGSPLLPNHIVGVYRGCAMMREGSDHGAMCNETVYSEVSVDIVTVYF